MRTRIENERTHWIGMTDYQVSHLNSVVALLQMTDLANFAKNMNLSPETLRGFNDSLNDLKGALQECQRKIS